jgi:hypothetical protein
MINLFFVTENNIFVFALPNWDHSNLTEITFSSNFNESFEGRIALYSLPVVVHVQT